MDDIIKRHFTKHSADTVWATPDGGISASDPCGEEGFWLDMYHGEVNQTAELQAEIEGLRDLCRRMAALLDDCRPHDATLTWVMGRIDVIEEWQSRRQHEPPTHHR